MTWRRTLFLVTAAAALLTLPLAQAFGSDAPAAPGTGWSYRAGEPATAATALATPPLTGGASPAPESTQLPSATEIGDLRPLPEVGLEPLPADLEGSPGEGVSPARFAEGAIGQEALTLPDVPIDSGAIDARIFTAQVAELPAERVFSAPLGAGARAPQISTVAPPPAAGVSGITVPIPRRATVASGGFAGGPVGGGSGGSGGYTGGGGWSYAVASWYGPGFYGNRTACGQTYNDSIIGVAHRSLPCGTAVQFRHNGRIVTAPVIDRGPYVGGRTWDLSAGLCRALGHCYTGGIQWRFP